MPIRSFETLISRLFRDATSGMRVTGRSRPGALVLATHGGLLISARLRDPGCHHPCLHPGSTVLIPSIAATAPSPRLAIRTGTAGCSRNSPRGCPVASTPQRRALHRQAILRGHFGVRRQPTVSTRSPPDSAMRTGQTGTPHTWWRSNLAKSCRNERPRRDRHRPGGTARLLIADSWRIHERRDNHRSRPARTGTLRANYRCHRRQAAVHGPHMRPPQRHRTGGRVYGRRCAPIF
jgi:hypothetical protein